MFGFWFWVHSFKQFSWLCLLIGTLGVAGCSGLQIQHQTQQFDQAIADSGRVKALRGILAASRGLDVSLTALTQFDANNMTSGSFTGVNPIAKSGNLTSALNWSSGVSQIVQVNANVTKANAQFNKQIGYPEIYRYQVEGMSFPLLNTIFVHTVEVHSRVQAALERNYRRECKGRWSPVCREIAMIRDQCGKWAPWGSRIALLDIASPEYFYIAGSAGAERCGFLKFQALMLMFRISRIVSSLSSGERCTKSKTPEQKTKITCRSQPQQILGSGDLEFQRLMDAVAKHLTRIQKKAGLPQDRQPIKFQFRSPRGVYKYLGHLVRLQNRRAGGLVPYILTRDGHRLRFFTVAPASGQTGVAAVAARGPFGGRYAIPMPDYDDPYWDRTLKVLTVAIELANTALSKTDLPAPSIPAVRVIQ